MNYDLVDLSVLDRDYAVLLSKFRASVTSVLKVKYLSMSFRAAIH